MKFFKVSSYLSRCLLNVVKNYFNKVYIGGCLLRKVFLNRFYFFGKRFFELFGELGEV